ncbi:MAG: hypothetical protein ACRC0L_09210, partial [Angustibacter sp.]
MMNHFYRLWGLRGHADTQCDTGFFYRLSSNQGRIETLPNIIWAWESSLGPVDTPPTDYPFTTVGPNPLSTRMREIIDANLGPADEVQWIPSAMHFNDEEIPY